jgi:hypothetical protein
MELTLSEAGMFWVPAVDWAGFCGTKGKTAQVQ